MSDDHPFSLGEIKLGTARLLESGEPVVTIEFPTPTKVLRVPASWATDFAIGLIRTAYESEVRAKQAEEKAT